MTDSFRDTATKILKAAKPCIAPHECPGLEAALATAIRELADKIAPVWKKPPSEEYELEYGQWITNNRIRRDMLAIVTELENAQ